MAIAFGVNGGSEISGVESDWQRAPIRTDTDGVTTYNNWALNIWRVGLMPGATVDTLKALQGQALTSLETNDIDDRDTAAQYTTVFLRSIAGAHYGLYLQNVIIEFMVKVA